MHTATTRFLVAAVTPEQFPDIDLPEMAFAGRSNVGKSSLINTLVGKRQMARVSATPGRTQSINFFLVNRDWVFVDLPGYGFAKVPQAVKASWRKLVEAYLVERVALQGVVLIVDLRRDPMDSDMQLKTFLEAHGIPFILVATKADKLSKQQATRQLARLARGFAVSRDVIVPFSAVTRAGRQELWESIREMMVEGSAKMKAIRVRRQEENRRRKETRGET